MGLAIFFVRISLIMTISRVFLFKCWWIHVARYTVQQQEYDLGFKKYDSYIQLIIFVFNHLSMVIYDFFFVFDEEIYSGRE